jgi:exosortase A
MNNHTDKSAVTITWKYRATLVVLAFMSLMAVFWPTVMSMVSTWWRSETFAHGFLILPISLYLVWRLRRILATTPVNTNLWLLPVLLMLGFGWVLADVSDVLIVKQLSWVAMLVAMVWLLLGTKATWEMAFPLGFLFFAVPIGEGLIPVMMDFTAVFTVNMLKLSGIPVYSDGTFFSIPSGNWSVVEGCSGVRYLIASITLGVLYAYLTYIAFWRRALFISLAIIFPIIANGLRAYMIVMIAHLSDMKLALGVDHFIYGWVFFGIVMFFLFWIGSFWREREVHSEEKNHERSKGVSYEQSHKSILALFAGFFAVAIWPAWSSYLLISNTNPQSISLTAPKSLNSWDQIDVPFTDWIPRYIQPTSEMAQSYIDGHSNVGIYIAYYGAQDKGAELVNSQNVMVVQKDPVWRMPKQYGVEVNLGSQKIKVIESQIKSSNQNLLIWHWYWLGSGVYTSNSYEAKFREAIGKVFSGNQDGAGIVVYTEMGNSPEKARKILQGFVDNLLPGIEGSLLNEKQ